MADEGLPIPNPENFTSSPSLQTHIGLYVVTGKEHYLTPDNKYDPSTDAQIKADVKSTVDNKGAITDEDVIKNLDTAHRNERKANWETISVEDKMIELFGTDGKSEGWKKNAAGNKLRQGKTELTDAEKTFVAQFEIWSQNFQAHFDLADNKQQVFLNKFLGSTSLVIDKNADFQKVALETYEQFIRKLDTKQAQKSTAFIDRVKTVYGSVDIPKEDMTMIATLAEQLFGGETMGKVIAEIVDLQAKLRSGNPAAVQAQLSKEIGETPPQETIDTIIRFRNLADIAEEKYNSATPPKPTTPTPTLAPAPGTGAGTAPAQPTELLQTVTPKDNERLMKKVDEVIELAPPTKTKVIVNDNTDYFGTDVDDLAIDSNGYAFVENVKLSMVKGNGSCHLNQNNKIATLAAVARVYCQTATKQSSIEIWGGYALLFTPKGFIGQINPQRGADLNKQQFFVPNDIDTATNRTEKLVNGHKYVVVECANAKGEKALAVFQHQQIAEPGKDPQPKLIFIDGETIDNLETLENRLLSKTGQLIELVSQQDKDDSFSKDVLKQVSRYYTIIRNCEDCAEDFFDDIERLVHQDAAGLYQMSVKQPEQLKQALLQYSILEKAKSELNRQYCAQLCQVKGKIYTAQIRTILTLWDSSFSVKKAVLDKQNEWLAVNGQYNMDNMAVLKKIASEAINTTLDSSITKEEFELLNAYPHFISPPSHDLAPIIARLNKKVGIAEATIPAPEAPKPEPIPEAKVAKLVERMKANNAKINDAKITTEIARLNQESGLTQEIVQGVIDRFDDIKDAERVTAAPGAEDLIKRQNSAIEIVEQTLGIKTADSKLLGYRLNELLQQLKVPFENDKYKIDPQKINEIKVMVQLLKLL